MSRVFIGIGSNQGDRLERISSAVRRLSEIPGVTLRQMAPICETHPVGGPPQPDFLNTVLELDTTLAPEELLGRLKGIEAALGRRPLAQRWGPRVIDLDVLMYDDRVVASAQLTIPHAQMHQRRFVLEPFAQLAPDVVHPVLRKTIAELLRNLVDRPSVTRPVASVGDVVRDVTE